MHPRITHLFYELGFLLEKIQDVSDSTILAIDIEYENYQEIKKSLTFKKIHLDLMKTMDFLNYKKSFLKGRAELLAGNCYQFNLTCEHQYAFRENYTPEDFIFSLWKKPENSGAFGNATYIPNINKLYLSNSPECLFQVDQLTLKSMPIKGTIPFNNNFNKNWKKLINDKKNESELFMIIDLMTNDLAKIDKPCARVIKKKAPLIVPGLMHQYALIEVKLSPKITIKNIIEKIFPGGSITGAPKKRVMQILSELEKRERKFYCGSTLICRRSVDMVFRH